METQIIAFIFHEDKLYVRDGQLPIAVLQGVADVQLHAMGADHVLNTPSGFSLDSDQQVLASPAFVFIDKDVLFWGYVCTGQPEGTWLSQEEVQSSALPSLHKQCAYHAFSLYAMMSS